MKHKRLTFVAHNPGHTDGTVQSDNCLFRIHQSGFIVRNAVQLSANFPLKIARIRFRGVPEIRKQFKKLINHN